MKLETLIAAIANLFAGNEKTPKPISRKAMIGAMFNKNGIMIMPSGRHPGSALKGCGYRTMAGWKKVEQRTGRRRKLHS